MNKILVALLALGITLFAACPRRTTTPETTDQQQVQEDSGLAGDASRTEDASNTEG